MSNPRCFTLFRGGGGWETRLTDLVLPVGGVEIDPAIAAVCDANLPGAPTTVADVCAFDYDLAPSHEIGLASPVCKNASQAKTGGGETEEDRAAGQAVCRYLRACKPPLFFLENVWGYRHFIAFTAIATTLRELGYTWDLHHLNTADWGVPQTRKRLILRATRAGGLPPLQPTHSRTGDWFHAPWVGWYTAIADLIATLPLAALAPWQVPHVERWLARHWGAALVASGHTGRAQVVCGPERPAWTVMAGAGRKTPLRALLIPRANNPRPHPDTDPSVTITTNGTRIRGVLVDSQKSGSPDGERGPTLREATLPAYTVTAGTGSARPARAALLVSGTDATVRPAEAPAVSMTATQGNGTIAHRALLIEGTGANSARSPQIREGSDPVWTVRSHSRLDSFRAWLDEVVIVQMTVQALARFQSFPDAYRLPVTNELACTIIGQAVPPLLAKCLIEPCLRLL